jgi:hypothetical protein
MQMEVNPVPRVPICPTAELGTYTIADEVNTAIRSVLERAAFIVGEAMENFELSSPPLLV